MWNYSYIIPNTLVLAVIAAHYFSRPRLSLRMNRLFLQLLSLEALITVVDVAACVADEAYATVPGWLLYALNMVFFVLYLIRVFWFYRIIAAILKLKITLRSALLSAAVCVLSLLITLSSFWTDAVFFVDAGGYHSGGWYHLLSVCAFFYLLLSLAVLLANARRLSTIQLVGALGIVLILAVGYMVRLLMPMALVMDAFCVLAIVDFYLVFENPDLYLDNHSAFNTPALRDRLTELIETRKPFRLLAVGVRSYYDARAVYGGHQMDVGLSQVTRYLKREFGRTSVFYIHNGIFVLLGDEALDLVSAREKISERFRSAWKDAEAVLDLSADFAHTDDSAGFDSADRIISNIVATLEKSDGSDTALSAESLIEADRQTEVKRALSHALSQNSVEVFLQPLIDAATGRAVGAEALARIRNAEGALIPPGLFIPLAEKNGSIHRLGEQMLEKTCEIIRKYDLPAHGIEVVNVNLSPIQCMRKDLSERFSAILRRSGVSPKHVPLELTEAIILDDSLMHEQLSALDALGFPFVLDDYGSGYSNITRVGEYSFRSIKLDMGIVRAHFGTDKPVLPTLVQMFRGMGYRVTAEGVETEEMAEEMRKIGCDNLQGFLFDRPLPVEEFVRKYASAG